MNFPCSFVIKIFGRLEANLETSILPIIRQHIDDMTEVEIKTNLSSGSKFTAVSIHFTARSQEQLDNLYRELTANPDVLMAL